MFYFNYGKDNLGKFDAKSDEGLFLGYLFLSKAYRVENYRISSVEEYVHVDFDESPQNMGKGICYVISGVIMENLINYNIPKEDPTATIIKEDIIENQE